MSVERAMGAVLVAALEDPGTAERVAGLLAPYIAPPAHVDDGWLSTKAAAAYLGITPNALHKATGAKALPFEQETPNSKCWFRRSDLDNYRRGVSTELPSALRAA
jgi:hypothetical protein